MKNLGKLYLLLIVTATFLQAGVTAKVEPRVLYSGDSASYILTVSGENIEKPRISTICGNNVTATSSQTSIQSINGKYAKSYTLSYQFTPKKSCKIDGVELSINGVIEKSNSVNLEIKKMQINTNPDFILSLQTTKKELYVGEPFELLLTLKQKVGAQAVDNKFTTPDFKGFWKKSESEPEVANDGVYISTKVLYKLAPQREGTLTVSPAELKIATRIGRNNWGTLIPQVRWKTYYSNELSITAKALPNASKIIGNFTINARVDKKEIHPNEAVNLLLSVSGSGNLEDMKSFKPFVSRVNVFDEKIIIDGDELSQKLVFVGDNNFTIPSFKLEFFNPVSKKVEIITTDKIDIKVIGSVEKTPLKIQRDTTDTKVEETANSNAIEQTQTNNEILYSAIAFVIGIMLGVVLMLVKNFKLSNREKKIDIKDEKVLLMKLLEFKDDEEVQVIVDILESNLYSKEKREIDKKALKSIIKKYEINS
ncbi:BatD family protein [Sulfurimonas sp.]|jgi:hypothetical protein|uniref:BatD family protein n=1 Tax=Sulfurimonas sp. TaxID=2022749 RepID=UPI0025F9A322|nr:BatD family protein [Sulfurimonas sp.]MBT5934370.1 oxygen-tolerance protein [Sulfurimonas sp.]